MAQTVTIYTSPPPALLALLSQHIPHSLPLLRRLQFTRFPGGITEHTKILWCSDTELTDDKPARTIFAAGYLDFSRGPETELWLYASVEHHFANATPTGTSEVAECGNLAARLLQEVKRIRDEYSEERRTLSTILIGTLSETLRQLLVQHNVVFPYVSVYDKWLFRVDELPDVTSPLTKGMHWGSIRREDISLVLSRTDIPRKEYVGCSGLRGDIPE
jgi:hypothetical protein